MQWQLCSEPYVSIAHLFRVGSFWGSTEGLCYERVLLVRFGGKPICWSFSPIFILTYDLSRDLLSTDISHCLFHSVLLFYTKLCWTLLSRPLSLTVSGAGSLYYSSPSLPGYLYQLLQSVCLSAPLAASVYTNTDISTCICGFRAAYEFWAWNIVTTDTQWQWKNMHKA